MAQCVLNKTNRSVLKVKYSPSLKGLGVCRFRSEDQESVMIVTIYPFFQASPSAFLLRAKPASTFEPGLR
jgi:hypothetical protein